MTKQTGSSNTKGIRISSGDRPTVVSAGRSPMRLVGGLTLISILGIAAFFFTSMDDSVIAPNALKKDRQRIATMSRGATSAVQTLGQEPCHQVAIIKLIQAYKKTDMLRAIVNEISEFERSCAPIPEARFTHLQALLLLSEFEAALPVADALVAANLAAPDAWAARADVKENLGDLEGASHDLRQALALFPDPSRVGVSSWYRLTEVLSRQGRFCEAVTPLQIFVSFDPTKRRTQQISTLLSDLRREGKCVRNSEVRKVALRFPPGAPALVVDAEINGVPGRFIVDTGASIVALTHEFASRTRLAVVNSKVLRINTANGPIEAKMSYGVGCGMEELQRRANRSDRPSA